MFFIQKQINNLLLMPRNLNFINKKAIIWLCWQCIKRGKQTTFRNRGASTTSFKYHHRTLFYIIIKQKYFHLFHRECRRDRWRVLKMCENNWLRWWIDIKWTWCRVARISCVFVSLLWPGSSLTLLAKINKT